MRMVRIPWKDTENMKTVEFIGSGQIGSTVARLAIDAGHQVVLSNSRGPETLADTTPVRAIPINAKRKLEAILG
jgi:predicted dinucleotide-binding enzyme